MDNKKILVVDDDQDILDVVEKRLVNDGFDVDVASSGQDAIAKAQSFMPNLILMDIVLPDIDGSEAVKRLKEIPQTADIPIIFLSGIVTSEEGEGGETKSEVKVAGQLFPAIGKPFTYSQLAEEINLILS